MATAAHSSDVENLAIAVLGLGTSEGTVAYRPGQPLFSMLQADDEFDEITVDVAGQTSNLRETVAALDGIQLAFDAAAAAVEYRIRYADDYQENGEADERDVRDRLRLLLTDAAWDLEIIELRSPGSFRARLKALANNPAARKKILAVSGLAASIVPAIFTPLIGVPAAVVSLMVVADAFLPTKSPKEFLTERLETEQAQERGRTGFDNPEWERAVKGVFDEGFDKLTAYLEQQRLESLAREEATNARIEELEFALKKLGGTPPPAR